MSVYEQGGKAAEEGANMARAAIRKGEAKAEQTFAAAQQGFEIAGDGARQMNLKMLHMMRANTEKGSRTSLKSLLTRDPSKLVEIWGKYRKTRCRDAYEARPGIGVVQPKGHDNERQHHDRPNAVRPSTDAITQGLEKTRLPPETAWRRRFRRACARRRRGDRGTGRTRL